MSQIHPVYTNCPKCGTEMYEEVRNTNCNLATKKVKCTECNTEYFFDYTATNLHVTMESKVYMKALLRKEGDLRVWWIPQIPMEAFYVNVDSIEEGKKVQEILANYDLFQFEHKVKPDYSNAGGIERYEEEEHDWFGVDEEDEI